MRGIRICKGNFCNKIGIDIRKSINAKNLLKFILGSAFGIMMFLVPIPQGDSFTTLLDYLKNFLKSLFGGALPYILVVIITGSAILSMYDYFCKPDWIRKNDYLRKGFSTTPLYLISKVIGAVVTCMVVFGVGPEFIISADTGASIVSLCGTLFCIVLGFSFILPFLTDCGIMEFMGVLLKPVVRPLFHVPGRASIDLIPIVVAWGTIALVIAIPLIVLFANLVL